MLISGISIILFIILILIRSLKSNPKNLFLILILLVFIPILIAYGYLPTGNEENVQPIFAGSILSILLIGPLIFDYTNLFYNPKQIYTVSLAKYWPVLISIILLFIAFLFLNLEHRACLMIFLGFCGLINLLYYLKKNYNLQNQGHKKLKLFYAVLNDKDLFWVNIPLLGLCIFLFLDAFLSVVYSFSDNSSIYMVNSIFLNVLIWFIAYFGLTQQKIQIEQIDDELIEPGENDSRCETEEFKSLKEKLII